MRVEEQYVLNASAMYTVESRRKLSNRTKLEMVEVSGCQGVLKMYEAFGTGIGYPRADISYLFTLNQIQ